MGKPTVGSSTRNALPENIEMSGHLMKAGGQEGQNKKRTRFFTLGDKMMAYFDCEDASNATIEKLKGTFPIEENSKVETVGEVDGQAEGLSWKTGYAFEITSSGRTFKLYAGSKDDAKGWTRAVNTMIRKAVQEEDGSKPAANILTRDLVVLKKIPNKHW
jgi:hypothetical protein